MNWEAIGAIGEVIGAIAVVSTLAYFALQIQDTKRSGMAQGTLTAVQLFSNWRTSLVQNTDLAAAFAKLNIGEELSETERILVQTSFDELLMAAAVQRSQVLQTGSLHEMSADVEYLLHVFEAIPGVLSLWNDTRSVVVMVSPELVSDLDKRLVQIGYSEAVPSDA